METKVDQSIPVAFIPTPTIEYRKNRKLKKSTEANGTPVPLPLPHPFPPLILEGSRVLIYKQDPSVTEIGIRKAYIPNYLQSGPKDGRITSLGLTSVAKNAFGDFIQTPGSDAFDAVHTFSVVRMTLTMVQRSLNSLGISNQVPWYWNSATNTLPLEVYAHGLPDVMNAYYQRNARCLRFGDFIKPGSSPAIRVYTCRSLDIVAHETGHAILDGLKPGWITSPSAQTGGLHESFGDLCAIFLTLSQLDQVEAIIAQTKSKLHDKTFLSDMAEEFGLALGRPNGLRNADNNLKLSEAGTEVHAISQVFTGAIYDIIADIFAFERSISKKDDAKVLYDVGQYVLGLVLRAIINAPNTNANYADIANQMLSVCAADGKPVQYRNYIRNQFTLRQVVVSPTPLTANYKDGTKLKATEFVTDAVGDRCTCCGTMKQDEFNGHYDKYLENELDDFKKSMSKKTGK
ncbi:MAG: hypothetical protein U0U67_11905 [Chitinophagales bacterium]